MSIARQGDNLFTCSLVALNVDTGKMAWHFQTSPHDTHDWDSAQTPILIDGILDGRPRKLVSTAARNGYFFTLDRVTGEHIVTKKYGTVTNWAQGIRPSGEPEPDPAKEAIIPGTLVSPVEGGVTNWPPPAYSPDTELFYVHERNGFNMLYLTDPDPRGSMGLGGKARIGVGSHPSYLTAIDYRTGDVVWRHQFPGVNGEGGAGGILATAGRLLFTGAGVRGGCYGDIPRFLPPAFATNRGVHVSSTGQQRFHGAQPAGSGGGHQNGLSPGERGVGIGTGLQEQLHEPLVSVGAG